jgi:hypothetical protein
VLTLGHPLPTRSHPLLLGTGTCRNATAQSCRLLAYHRCYWGQAPVETPRRKTTDC